MRYSEKINPLIVNYRTPDLTLKCVDSIVRMGVSAPENIIVVDNKSPDDSAERLERELKGVKFVKAERNGGFSAGINVGTELADREFLLVLNPDTYFQDQSVEMALDLMERHSDIGLVGLDLVYPNGERQYSARRFYSMLDIIGRRLPLGRYWPLKGRIRHHMMMDEWVANKPFDAEWVMGTGFIIRRELFDRIGRMDESYFLYMEDVDLCARVWGAGYRVVCVPNAVLVHDHQRSSAAGPLSWAGRMHLTSLGIFRKKYRVPLLKPPGVKRIHRVHAA